jgi:type I restriction enzyme S subunit
MSNKIRFKQTEVGMIPEDWDLTYIECIAAREKYSLSMGPFGSNITKDNFVPHGVPVIRGNNLTAYRFLDSDFVFVSEEKANELLSSNARANDIVVTHRGTLGQVAIIPEISKYRRYVVSQSGMKLTCDRQQVDPNFVFYWLKSPRGQRELLKNTSQTGVPAIAQPLSSLRKVMLPRPQIAEQHAIAKVFLALDSKIELNQRMNKTLEAISKGIFKHWFIDFSFPNEAGKSYKSSGGEMVYNKELEREIPKGWKVNKLEEFIELDKGLSYKGEFLSDAGIPLVNLGTFAPGAGFIREGLKHYVGEHKEKHLVKVGDIVIANTDITQKREVLGSPAIVPPYLGSETALFTHHIFAVRNKSDLPVSFIYHLLQTSQYRDRVRGFATGTTVLALPKDAVLDLSFVVPNREVLKQFDALHSVLYKKANSLIVQSELLAKTRNSLLPKLMSGKIRVPI